MSSTSFHSTATMRYWKKKNATFGIDEKELFKSVFSRFAVETVHNCDCCSEVWSEFHRCISAWLVQWDIPVFLISLILLRGWAVGVVFLCQFIHLDALLLGPANLVLRITMYWISLETIVNSIKILFDASLPRVVGQKKTLSVPQFCRAEYHVVAPFWWSSVGLRKLPVATGENFGWIRYQSRDVQKCNRLFLDSNKEGILSIALWELLCITRIALHCPCHESSLLIRHWMGCRRHFVANRLEVLLDEDDSRSSSRVREHGSFLLVSQLHVAIQTLWSQCLFPRAVWTNPMDCSLSSGLTVLIWSAFTFSSASLSWSKRSTDTGTQLLTSLPVLTLVLSQSNKTRLSVS